LLNFLLLALLLVFAWLRELPLFWMNAGHWPVWLRELVGLTFYPLLLLELSLLIGVSAMSGWYLTAHRPGAGALLLVLSLLWGLVLLVALIIVTDAPVLLSVVSPLAWPRAPGPWSAC
jgi:hypothetical protein